MNQELPQGWAVVQVQELFHSFSGGTPSRSNPAYWGGKIPWFSSGDIKSPQVTSASESITRAGLDNSSARLCRPGSVLIVVRSGVLKHTLPVAILEREAAINQDLKCFDSGDDAINKWLALSLRASENVLLALNREGTTVQSVKYETLKEHELPIPPLAEQQRIVAKLEVLLGKVDACRKRLEKIPVILKRFRQSVLAAACSGRLTADWRDNIDARSCDVRPDETAESGLPCGWRWSCAEEIRSSDRHSLAIGPFGSNLKVSDYAVEGTPLVFVREIRARSFGTSGTKYVSHKKAEELAAHSISGGDLLITKMGEPPGDVAIYPLGAPVAIITADCVKLRIDEAIANPLFVGYVIESLGSRERLQEITAGVAQQKISLGRFRQFPLQLAPIPEQHEIVRRVEALFALADQVETRYTKAKTHVDRLTQSILAKAFRGDLVPQDPKDEPASVLLEHILSQRQDAGMTRKQSKYKRATAAVTTG